MGLKQKGKTMGQRLIDANALWELMRTYDEYQGAKEAHDLELIHRDSILFAIETAPTVDAVQVVRCRECIHQMTCGFVSGRPYKYRADWFCADGERRSDEQQ